MGQEQPRPDYNDEPELERTQPSPTRPPRRLDWRPPQFKGGGRESKQQTPPVRRVQMPARRHRRPPTEGAPTWVVGLGIGALVAVIILLVVAFVFSRRSGEPEPSPTAVVVTPTRTLAPRPTATIPLAATATASPACCGSQGVRKPGGRCEGTDGLFPADPCVHRWRLRLPHGRFPLGVHVSDGYDPYPDSPPGD